MFNLLLHTGADEVVCLTSPRQRQCRFSPWNHRQKMDQLDSIFISTIGLKWEPLDQSYKCLSSPAATPRWASFEGSEGFLKASLWFRLIVLALTCACEVVRTEWQTVLPIVDSRSDSRGFLISLVNFSFLFLHLGLKLQQDSLFSSLGLIYTRKVILATVSKDFRVNAFFGGETWNWPAVISPVCNLVFKVHVSRICKRHLWF